jgi:hypothetical protein
MTHAPFCLDSCAGMRERMQYTLWDELREIAWVARWLALCRSLVSGLPSCSARQLLNLQRRE